MNIFDLLAEWNITSWLRKADNNSIETGNEPKVSSTGKTNFGKPYEGHLLDDIKSLLSQAYEQEEGAERQSMMTQARKLETQMLMSYEKQGYNMLASNMQSQLRAYEKELAENQTSRTK